MNSEEYVTEIMKIAHSNPDDCGRSEEDLVEMIRSHISAVWFGAYDDVLKYLEAMRSIFSRSEMLALYSSTAIQTVIDRVQAFKLGDPFAYWNEAAKWILENKDPADVMELIRQMRINAYKSVVSECENILSGLTNCIGSSETSTYLLYISVIKDNLAQKVRLMDPES